MVRIFLPLLVVFIKIKLNFFDSFVDLGIATPASSSIVTIPAQSQRAIVLPAQKQNESSTSAPTTAYTITYSSSVKDATYNSQNIQLVKSAAGNYLITTPTANANIQSQILRNNVRSEQHQQHQQQHTEISPTARDHESISLQELQKQEQLLRIREATLRCDVQELEKEKAKEELIQMREIHRMKIKEMEMRLRNMERS